MLKGLKWMLRADAPLLVSPKLSWHKLSWFAEFIAAMPHYERNTIETTRLAIAARGHLFEWAETEGIPFDLKREGILHIYRDKASFDHAGRVSELLARGGLERRAVTPTEMRAIEPILAGNYFGGYYTESDSTGDIHRFTFGLAQAAARRGVECLYGQQVDAIRSEVNGVTIIAIGPDGQSCTRRHDGVAAPPTCSTTPAMATWAGRCRP
jgi:D-amino-acid dehydrogenase